KGLLGERSLPRHSPQYMHWGADFRLQLLKAPFELERNGAQDPLVDADVADRLAAETGLEPVETEPGVVGRRFLRDPPPVVGMAAERFEVEHRLPVQQVIRHQFALAVARAAEEVVGRVDRKSTRLNSSHRTIAYGVFCL